MIRLLRALGALPSCRSCAFYAPALDVDPTDYGTGNCMNADSPRYLLVMRASDVCDSHTKVTT